MTIIKLLKMKVKITVLLASLLAITGIMVTFLLKASGSRCSKNEVEHTLPMKSKKVQEVSNGPENYSLDSDQEMSPSRDDTDNSEKAEVKESKSKKRQTSGRKITQSDKSRRGVKVKKISEIQDASIPLGRKDFSSWNKSCEWNLILLNDSNSITSETVPKLRNYCGTYVNAGIFGDLNAMINAAKKDGIDLWISSCYRSFKDQDILHKNKIKFYINNGNTLEKAQELACKVVARPGTSEHNLALAIDFNGVRDDFYLTKEYKWLVDNGDDYGFVLRYDKNKQKITNKIYEPWHFRYVGEKHAKSMKKLGFCLEEYIEYLVNKIPHK